MCTTTKGTQAAGQDAVRQTPPNVIPLAAYLQKAVTASAAKLVPASPPPLPPNVKSTHVAFSLWPLLSDATSGYYAGIYDDETDFSASLVKVAAMFAAGQFHAEATAFAQGYAAWAPFLSAFNTSLQAEINATADARILTANFFLKPQTAAMLKQSAFPSIVFADGFRNNLAQMIVASDDPSAAVCTKALGYGYISTALKKENFFDSNTSNGIWLAGTYDGVSPYVRIPCVNDHDDAQLTTTRLMCKLFSMIRLKQLPENDLDANTQMQGWLNEPKSAVNGYDPTMPWLSTGRNPGVAPLFSILQDKIGYAGLGSNDTPNVYSEGLIIQWTDQSKVDSFNKIIDPTNANPGIHLSGEIAVCWQNLLAEIIPGGTVATPMFDPIIDVINDSLRDFLTQAAL